MTISLFGEIYAHLKAFCFFFQAYIEKAIPDDTDLDESYYMGFNLLNWTTHYFSLFCQNNSFKNRFIYIFT